MTQEQFGAILFVASIILSLHTMREVFPFPDEVENDN